MAEPRWRDVDLQTRKCSHCDGTHYGTGLECPYREENMGEPCLVCKLRTNYCCSDCAIDDMGKVYVCTHEDCRDVHQRDHDARAARKVLPAITET